MNRYLICLAILAMGCEPDRPSPDDFDAYRECVQWKGSEVMEFVVKCSEAANPKSDEEGEDLVAQCHKTGKAFGCLRHVWVVRRIPDSKCCDNPYQSIPCLMADGYAKDRCDAEQKAFDQAEQ